MNNPDNDKPEISKYVNTVKDTYRIERSRTDFQSASRIARASAVQEILNDHKP